MRFFVTFSMLMFCTLSAFAQTQECKLEAVTLEELSITEYPEDPEAEAYVIFDKGISEFVNKDGKLHIKFIRTKKIKVLNNDGIKYGEVSIPLYIGNVRDREVVRRIEAYSYNLENGTIQQTKYDKKEVFEEKVNEYWSRKKFVTPNVKAGSVIEYRYIVESPFYFNLPDWEFQNRIPTKYSEYIVKTVPFYNYQYIVQGTHKFDYFNTQAEKALPRTYAGVSFNNIVSKMVMNDLPAFRDESYITSTNDYIVRVNMQLSQVNYPGGRTEKIMTTWPKLRSDMMESDRFGGFIKKSKKQAEKILESELVFTDETPVEKTKMIIAYAKQHYIWNGFYGKYADKTAKELIKDKTADAATINLFTVALLQAAGLQAEPVILSTRKHGKIELDYPFSTFFNYTIIRVKFDEGDLLADASDPMVPFNRLPPRCLNEIGLTINDAEQEEWVRLNADRQSTTNHKVDITPDPTTGNNHISIISQSIEYDAYYQKKRVGKDEAKWKETLLKDGFEDVETVKIKGYDDNMRPFIVAYTGAAPTETLDRKLVIAPFFNLPMAENLLKAKERTYPVDFIYPQTKNFNAVIHIPDGYTVNYVPAAYHHDDDLVTIDYKSQKTETDISITAIVKYKKAVYQPKDYALLKGHLSTVVERFNDAVVLEEE